VFRLVTCADYGAGITRKVGLFLIHIGAVFSGKKKRGHHRTRAAC